MASTFADRLWWARYRAGLGATRLARMVGCAQSLISGLERNNADSSRLAKEFAKALKVDAHWLAYGTGTAPEGFDEEEARVGRESQGRNSGPMALRPGVVQIRPAPLPTGGRTDLDALMSSLVADFMDFTRLAGLDRAKALCSTMTQFAEVIASESTERQNQGGSNDHRPKKS